jgi:hypothetical protein
MKSELRDGRQIAGMAAAAAEEDDSADDTSCKTEAR